MVLKLYLIFSIIIMVLAKVTANEEDIVDIMKNWYDRRLREASEIEYPTDAQMYEAENKIPQGTVPIL